VTLENGSKFFRMKKIKTSIPSLRNIEIEDPSEEIEDPEELEEFK